MIGYDGINATSYIDWNQVIFSNQATRRLNPRLAFARKEKSSSDSEESDKGECVGVLFEQWVSSYLLLPRKSQR